VSVGLGEGLGSRGSRTPRPPTPDAIAAPVRRHEVPLDATTVRQGHEVVGGQRVIDPTRQPAPGAHGRGRQQLATCRLVGGTVSALSGCAAASLPLALVGGAAGPPGEVRAGVLEAGAEGHGGTVPAGGGDGKGRAVRVWT